VTPRTRLRATLVVGAVLAYPAVRTYLDGAIPIDTAAIRVFVAMAFALLAVSAIGALLSAYAPKPAERAPDPAIEDAEMVEDTVVVTEDADVLDEPPV
jgi:hypothetical protein